MSKPIKISEWPFNKGEEAKLIWIGEPFKKNKEWMVKVYFRSMISSEVKLIVVHWLTIHFLTIGRKYKEGILNQSEVAEETSIIHIDLTGIPAFYNEKEFSISGTGEKQVSRTFSFKKNGQLYVIPAIEIIRSVLGIDSFTLRLLLSMESIEEYLSYEKEGEVLKLYFSQEYNKKLLTKGKIYHLAWILTNKDVFGMFNELSYNYGVGGDKNCKFQFTLKEFDIKARVKRIQTKIIVQEIIELKNKSIPVKQINVEHPMLSFSYTTGQPKKREFITYTGKEHQDLSLENNVDGANRSLDLIDSLQITHRYNEVPSIIKSGIEKEYKRKATDDNTERYFQDDKGRRTLADVGGENISTGIEFINVEDVKIKGELEIFICMIKLLIHKPEVQEIKVLVNKLPLGNGGKFAWLEDEVTPRKYVLCKVTMRNGRERLIIEIEKEYKALSTIICMGSSNLIWDKICSILLYGLVKTSGSWRKEDILWLDKLGIKVVRKKHSHNSLEHNVDRIYKELIWHFY